MYYNIISRMRENYYSLLWLRTSENVDTSIDRRLKRLSWIFLSH